MTDAKPILLADCFAELEKSAHKEYLETWSIITEGAEADGKYSDELIYRVIQNQQNLASDLSTHATCLEKLIEQLEGHLGIKFEF